MNTKQILEIKKKFNIGFDTNEDIKPEEYHMLMDTTNVMALVPKNTTTLKALHCMGDYSKQNLPYISKKGYSFGMFSKEYLISILKTILATDSNDIETITIGVKEGFPLIIETKEIGFILAPRIDNDDNVFHHSDIIKTMVD